MRSSMFYNLKGRYAPTVVAANFIICGFVGWMYETALTSLVFGRFAERGVLHVPLLPIYGVFALVLPLFFNRETPWPKVFVLGTVGATVFELIAAFLTEAVFHQRLWDYLDWPLNFFDGRISVGSSLIFGGMIVLFIKAIEPLTGYMRKNGGRLFDIAVLMVAVGAILGEVYLSMG